MRAMEESRNYPFDIPCNDMVRGRESSGLPQHARHPPGDQFKNQSQREDPG